jgi:hypothetical protein
MVNAETRGKLHIKLIADAIGGNDNLKDRFQKKFREWIALIETEFHDLLDKELDIHLFASIVVSSITGFTIQHLMGIRDTDYEKIGKYLTNKPQSSASCQ